MKTKVAALEALLKTGEVIPVPRDLSRHIRLQARASSHRPAGTPEDETAISPTMENFATLIQAKATLSDFTGSGSFAETQKSLWNYFRHTLEGQNTRRILHDDTRAVALGLLWLRGTAIRVNAGPAPRLPMKPFGVFMDCREEIQARVKSKGDFTQLLQRQEGTLRLLTNAWGYARNASPTSATEHGQKQAFLRVDRLLQEAYSAYVRQTSNHHMPIGPELEIFMSYEAILQHIPFGSDYGLIPRDIQALIEPSRKLGGVIRVADQIRRTKHYEA